MKSDRYNISKYWIKQTHISENKTIVKDKNTDTWFVMSDKGEIIYPKTKGKTNEIKSINIPGEGQIIDVKFLPFKKAVSVMVAERCPEDCLGDEIAESAHDYYFGLVTPSGYVIDGGKIEGDVESFDPSNTQIMQIANMLYKHPTYFNDIQVGDVASLESIQGYLDIAKQRLAEQNLESIKRYHKNIYKKGADLTRSAELVEIQEMSKTMSNHFVEIYSAELKARRKAENQVKFPTSQIDPNELSKYGLKFKSHRDPDGSFYEQGMTILTNESGDKFYVATFDVNNPTMLNISKIDKLPGDGKLIAIQFMPAYSGVSRFIATYKSWGNVSKETMAETVDYYGFVTPSGYVSSTGKGYPTSERPYLYEKPYEGIKILEEIFKDPKFYSLYLEHNQKGHTTQELLAMYDVANYALQRRMIKADESREEYGEDWFNEELETITKLNDKITDLTQSAYMLANSKETKKISVVSQTPVYPPRRVNPNYDKPRAYTKAAEETQEIKENIQ